MREGAAAPSPSFRRRGRVPRRGAISYPSAHKKRMKPNVPSVPETAYLLFSREPPGEFERAAALSTFLHIPATCAPRRFPLSGDARRGRSPFAFPSAGGGVYPAEERFPIRQRTKNGCSPVLHPFPKQLISFSAGNLRESLRGPQPFQLFFISRRPAHPAAPPFPGMRDFSIRQRTKNGCSPMLHPSPKQLISFSARNLWESLRVPQPFQLSFVSRRPAHPAVSPPPGDARRGRSPFAFLPQAGACTPPRSDFSIRQRTKNGCSPMLHPFPKPLPTENRFRFIKIRVRQRRARILMLPRARGDFLLRDFS